MQLYHDHPEIQDAWKFKVLYQVQRLNGFRKTGFCLFS